MLPKFTTLTVLLVFKLKSIARKYCFNLLIFEKHILKRGIFSVGTGLLPTKVFVHAEKLEKRTIACCNTGGNSKTVKSGPL